MGDWILALISRSDRLLFKGVCSKVVVWG